MRVLGISFLLIICISSLNAQVKLDLIKNYFANSSNPAAQENGFLAEDPADIAIDTIDNTYYTVNLDIGQGNQPFSVVPDTATSLLVVSTVNLESNTDNHFDCNTSDTCSLWNYLFPIGRKNDQTIRGSIIQDQVDLGNGSVAKNQRMILLNQNISILGYPTDGILGLAQRMTFIGIPIGVTPLLDNLQQQGVIPNKSFAIFLANDTGNDTNSTQSNASDLILGGYDPSHMDGDFAYYPLAEKNSWKIKVNSAMFNDVAIKTEEEILFDNRAGGIEAPEDEFNAILAAAKKIDSTCDNQDIGEVTVIQCSSCTKLSAPYPDLSFTFGDDGNTYTIPGDQYIYPSADGCVIAVVKSDSWTVGHQFMKNYYMYFDEDNKQIGIAPVAQA